MNNTALLIMDVQPGIVDRLPNKDEYIANATKAIAAAHEKNIPVIFVVVGFRPGVPEIGEKGFLGMKKDQVPPPFINPEPTITPAESDVVVTKRRVSAFSGSDLDVILRAKNIQHLVLAGIATSGVVLSTIREAYDKDFQLTVIKDLCSDNDPDVHSMLIEKVFPRQGKVITSQEWISSLA